MPLSGLVNLPSASTFLLTHRCRKDASLAFLLSPCNLARGPSLDDRELVSCAGIVLPGASLQRKPSRGMLLLEGGIKPERRYGFILSNKTRRDGEDLYIYSRAVTFSGALAGALRRGRSSRVTACAWG
eukprot:scaffold74114_cov60-Phaeocystis_antarctica.AAC.2